MKIGMILDNSFPPDPRVENEAMSLIKEGHEVYLFALSYDSDFENYEQIKGIHVCRYFCPKLMYKFSALAYTVPFYHLYFKNKIQHFIEGNNLHVIHIHDIQIARSIFYLKKKLNLKIILDLHENRPEIMKFYSHVNSVLGKLSIFPCIWKRFEHRFINKADKVIVVTDSAAKYYSKHFKVNLSKFAVVPNTVREIFYSDYALNEKIVSKYKDQFNFLYLGETGRRRGTFELLEAMKILNERNIRANLIIVGTSRDEELLKIRTNELGLEETVYIEGWQSFDLFQSFLAVSKVGMSPLHRNIHHDTTFANKIFQYASFGLPVIASDSSAQKEVLTSMGCGVFHEAKNVEELADKMIELFQDDELRSKLSANAKKAIREEYNWETISHSLVELYRNM